MYYFSFSLKDVNFLKIEFNILGFILNLVTPEI